MASWTAMKTRITASVRTTNRINALLTESMFGRRKALLKASQNEGENDGDIENEKPKNNWEFFRNNFSMERAYKLIETTIEERMTWDRLSRSYDSWRSLQLIESLAADIRNKIKKLNYRRYRIICVVSLVEKQNQGVNMRMRYLMDEKLDNYTNYVYERPTYFIVVTLFLVYKD
ncbi:dynein light chain Tctex-type protein 2B-like [Teleopsis dalmanni]|uniref:dynein light chain Tctex-type protein 2B-like n=1 Tax=Teleopsis dalmanni TaxID=139649 RepID=UPI0018CE8F1D|nr:dynein light chain Tctex-type protein 2B-like [Teleopsis dalmanni]XP_037954420.1 dynein light chain Tctex-type protein 2B-like [Teleopsis dalmanni]